MKIGIYGGSFDPVHSGHLILAREALETQGFDAVHLVPARVSPHKTGTPPVSAELRFEMLRVAVAGEAGLVADDTDLHLKDPSFAVDTVAEFRRRFPDAELVYFIGADNLPLLHTWHRFEDLCRDVSFLVFERGETSAVVVPPAWPVIRRRLDISSSEIRRRVAEGRSIRYLLPERVREMIHKNQLYQEEIPSPRKN